MRLNAFEHEDANIAYDPLPANRRFAGTRRLGGVGDTGFRWTDQRHDLGDGTRLLGAAGEQYGSRRFASPCGIVARISGGHDQLVSGGSLGAGLVSEFSIGHIGTPASGVLERAKPDPKEMEECQRQSLSGLSEVYKDKHGSSHPAEAHDLYVFLAVSGGQLLFVV